MFSRDEMDEFFGKPTKTIDYKGKLNDEQYEAVMTTEGPLLIIAGAGSGKTTVLTYRLAHLIEMGIMPERILLLTFTNKAANEMVSRAKDMLGINENIQGGTFHAFCAKILRKYHNAVGLSKNFIIKDTAEAADMVDYVKELEGYSKEDDFPKGKELVTMFSTSVNKGIPLEKAIKMVDHGRYRDYIDDIKKLRGAYCIYKHDRNILDYDDLLLYANKMLRENENIRKDISDVYKYIMVDEYQDSNMLQFELISLLRSFENKNICVVGDDQQCIYGFRGANHKNILNFPKQFDSKMIVLFRNYRSNQEILDFTNAVAMGAAERFDKELKGTHSSGHKPMVVYVDDEQMQAQTVLYDIIKRHRNGTKLNDIAVLIRSARDSYALEALITRYMTSNPIPFEKVGGPKFMEQECVRDVLAFMKVLVNEKDEVAWFRVFKIYPNIGHVYGRRLVEGINQDGIESLNDNKHKKRKYGEYLPVIYDWYQELQTKDLLEQVDMIINKYYYEAKMLVLENKKSKSSVIKDEKKKLDDNIESMQILIESAKPYNTASDFLNDITLDATASGERFDDRLTISTVHSAKGLEFDTVYVLGCVKGVFPWNEEGEEGEEERRVFYVATTRAKENLMMLVPHSILKFRQPGVGEITSFIKDNKHFCQEVHI